MLTRFRGLILDLDNTLVDTIPLLQGALHATGCPLPTPALISELTPREILDRSGHSHRWDQFVDDYLNRLQRDSRTFFPSAGHILRPWAESGRVMIATAAPRVAAEAALTGASCDYLIPFTITREDAAPKPSPESLLLARAQLGVPSSTVLYVGDSNDDFHASRLARIPFAHAVWGVSQPPLQGQSPDFCLATFEDLMDLLDLDAP